MSSDAPTAPGGSTTTPQSSAPLSKLDKVMRILDEITHLQAAVKPDAAKSDILECSARCCALLEEAKPFLPKSDEVDFINESSAKLDKAIRAMDDQKKEILELRTRLASAERTMDERRLEAERISKAINDHLGFTVPPTNYGRDADA